MDTCTELLAETGGDARLLLLAIVLIAAGLAALLLPKRRRASAGTATAVIAALVLAGGLALPASSAQAAESCPPAQSDPAPQPVTPPPAAPETPEEPETPDPEPPVCPAGGDLGALLEGESIVWVPVTTDDPTATPGTEFGETVLVYLDGISGFTWHIERTDGAVSPTCDGMPIDADACVPMPSLVSYTQYVWAEPGEWAATGSSGGTNGCSGGGGNN